MSCNASSCRHATVCSCQQLAQIADQSKVKSLDKQITSAWRKAGALTCWHAARLCSAADEPSAWAMQNDMQVIIGSAPKLHAHVPRSFCA